MSDRAVWVSGGNQPGHYSCSHVGCSKKGRNVDNWGRSPDLLRGDHHCCETARHSGEHQSRERRRAEAEAAAARRDAPPGPVTRLLRSVIRNHVGKRR